MVAEEREAFCVVEVNDAGPVQAYVAPLTVGVVKLMVLPAHSGELLVSVGVAGIAFTVILVVCVLLPAELEAIKVTVYVPAVKPVAV